MNKLLALVASIFLIASIAWGSSVSLAWDSSTDPSVVSYNIYMGSQSRAYTNSVSASCCTGAFTNLVPGVTYYFAATAVDSAGLESDYSVEVAYTVPISTNLPPGVPGPPVMQSLQRTQ